MTADVGTAPDLWPVRTEQHATYQRVHEYAIGRYLITMPAHYQGHNQSTSFSFAAKLSVREVQWPADSAAESGRDKLWNEHIQKLERDVDREYDPYHRVENITLNGYPARVSFYYDQGSPTIEIFGQTFRKRVDIYYLVDYGQHGVWFYDRGYAEEQSEVEAGIVALVKQYEPYPTVGQVTVKPGAYHMRRGVLNRPFATSERFGTRFSGKDADGEMSFGLTVEVTAEKFDKERYQHVPALFAEFGMKVLRQGRRPLMGCHGHELVIFGENKKPDGLEGLLDWWCSEEGYAVGYPDIKISSDLRETKNFEAQLAKWDFILNSMTKIESKDV